MDGYDAATYGERFADVYDEWYSDLSDIDAVIERIVDLGGPSSGPVVELGVGTGRLAIPLAAAGLDVVGVDASPAMLERLAAKPGGTAVRCVVGDLADPHLAAMLPDDASVVLLAFNTLFNLVTEKAQVTCLETARSCLAAGGAVVVEAFVPASDLRTFGTRLEPLHIGVDEVVLTVSRVEPDGCTVTGQHVHLREHGTRLRPWRLRVLEPSEIDRLARVAGLEPAGRDAGWAGETFDDDSDHHVSIYRSRDHRPDGSSR